MLGDLSSLLQTFVSATPNLELLSPGHSKKVLDVKTILLVLPTWTSIWGVFLLLEGDTALFLHVPVFQSKIQVCCHLDILERFKMSRSYFIDCTWIILKTELCCK